jgi:hypothetical protein
MAGRKQGPGPTTTTMVKALLQTPKSQAELREATGLGTHAIQSALTRLLENGRIQRIGTHGSSRYLVSSIQPPAAAGGMSHGPAGVAAYVPPALPPAWPAPRMSAIPFGRPLLGSHQIMEALQC